MVGTGEPVFSRSFGPRDCDYSALRHGFGQWLRELGAEPLVIGDWLLVLSELAANGCAATPAGGVIEVEAACVDDRLELRVTNPIDRPVTLRPSPAEEHASDRGRGLLIVDAIADHVEYDIDAHAVSVRATTALRPTASSVRR